ncbi:hypothetical protein STEG23_024615 [Scotinomys teguina]
MQRIGTQLGRPDHKAQGKNEQKELQERNRREPEELKRHGEIKKTSERRRKFPCMTSEVRQKPDAIHSTPKL